MRLKMLLFVLACCWVASAFPQGRVSRVNIIFDSDMGPDYDDAGAIAILHALSDRGEANILTTMASTRYSGVAGVLNVFNTYFNRPDIPIGVPKGAALDLRDPQHWTDTLLARYPHKITTNDAAADAVTLYRKILALQPDHSVTIVTVGFLTNLSNLLNTPADEYSALTGKELIKRKVKLLVTMGGAFPAGSEFNIMKDAAASKNVFENWGSPVIFSGYEIGVKIKAGIPLINNAGITNSPVKDAFRIAIPQAKEDLAGRSSWDETAVLVAIRGYAPWYRLHKGRLVVAADGSNTWDENGTGQAYLVEMDDYHAIQDIINKLIMHPPAVKAISKRSTGQVRPAGSPRMSVSTRDRIAKIEALSRKIDKIEANINRREKEIARAEKNE